MARIRTIKPEFWTDEKIVRLPFEGRLLFIGLWNFADDMGALDFSPDRIRMQIFPGDSAVQVEHLLDLLEVTGLVDYMTGDDGGKVLRVRNWSAHQKIDNPSRKTVLSEGYRKLAIPSEARIGVAKKYGASPGVECPAECYYCGAPGQLFWWMNSKGRPSGWVTAQDLEFDHFVSEHEGGENASKNMVLACRPCNRGKREFAALPFVLKKNSISLARTIESSPLEGKGKDQGKDQGERKAETSKNPEQPRKPAEPDKPPHPATVKAASRKTPLRPDFKVSKRVIEWAVERGFTDLPAHFESFVSKVKARGYCYVDWDEALMTAIRDDWAKLRKERHDTGKRYESEGARVGREIAEANSRLNGPAVHSDGEHVWPEMDQQLGGPSDD